jgi:uncharacterized protein
MKTAAEARRAGAWGCTVSGRQYWPADPRPGDFHIEDIAHALAHQCRYGGHAREFYSVAQHSVLVSHLLPDDDAMWGLLHDASEAYLVDLPRPAKAAPELDGYLFLEGRMQAAIAQQFDLPLPMPSNVHAADEILLATEARDLMPSDGPGGARHWSLTHAPLRDRISPWAPFDAKRRFLERFLELDAARRRRRDSPTPGTRVLTEKEAANYDEVARHYALMRDTLNRCAERHGIDEPNEHIDAAIAAALDSARVDIADLRHALEVAEQALRTVGPAARYEERRAAERAAAIAAGMLYSTRRDTATAEHAP